MEVNLKETLNKIANESQILNDKADSLTLKIQEIDTFLQNHNVGITCYYTEKYYEPTNDASQKESDKLRYYLGYDKGQNSKWCISVLCKSMLLDEAAIVNSTKWIQPFGSCSRNIRLSLAAYIPELITGIASSISNFTDQLDETLDSLDEISISLE